MSKPVDSTDFWKKRLEEAKASKSLHYSVYVAHETLWNKVCKVHEGIFAKEIQPSDKVLDIGCGYGRNSTLFDNYTGIDFSPDFIEEARRLFPNKKFVVGDVRDMPFKDKEFDVGIAISMRAMIVDNMGQGAWDDMEKEIKRVCKRTLIIEYGVFESARDTVDTIAEYEII